MPFLLSFLKQQKKIYFIIIPLINILTLNAPANLFAQTPQGSFEQKLLPKFANINFISSSIKKLFKNISDLLDRGGDLLRLAGTNALIPENKFPGITLKDFYSNNCTNVFTDKDFLEISGRILKEHFKEPIEIKKSTTEQNTPVTIYLNDGTIINGNGFLKTEKYIQIDVSGMSVTFFSEEIKHIETT